MGDLKPVNSVQESSGRVTHVMTVTTAGRVQSLQQGEPRDGANGKDLQSFFQPEVAARIQERSKRVILSREAFSEVVELGEGGRCANILLVPQGRDRVLLVATDVENQQREIERLRALAYKDRATGLLNREALLDELDRILQIRQRQEGRAAVICIHINNHDTGSTSLSLRQMDTMFANLGERLQAQLRGSNVGDDEALERVSLVARTDYRQLCVFLPMIETGEDAEAVTTRLIGMLSEPVDTGSGTIFLDPQAGVGLFPQDGRDAETLFNNACTAMEDARRSDHATFRFHTGTVRLRSLQRQDIATELRTALARGEYRLRFLPVIDAVSGKVPAIEALLHWPDNLSRMRSSAEIVDIASRTGVMRDIGDWVLQRGCEHLRTWHDSGHTELRLAINLSQQEYHQQDLAERLGSAADAAGVPVNSIDVEVIEHALMRDIAANAIASRALRDIGVGITIDHYGCGHSSLQAVAGGFADTLKLDRSIVRNAVTSAQDRAACEATIALARGLNMRAVGIGIETPAQFALLRSIGFELVQGFLFGQPFDADDVVAFIDSYDGDTPQLAEGA